MPTGTLKNSLYGAGLALLSLPSPCTQVRCTGPAQDPAAERLVRILRHRHGVGAAIQRIHQGALAECYTAGLASLSPRQPVTAATLFRTASIAKLVTASLVFRLQTLGLLQVEEPLEAFWSGPVRNPAFSATPITLSMLLSHTSSLVDSPAYFAAFSTPRPLDALLQDPGSYSGSQPGTQFRYSNFAAGAIACLLEARFQKSFEALAQERLFGPLGLRASFDVSSLQGAAVASSYRVLPPSKAPAFDAPRRIAAGSPLTAPDPESHYLLASGNLFISAADLARLVLPLLGGSAPGDAAPFLSRQSLAQLRAPLGQWPDHDVPLLHGMGLLTLRDPRISARTLYGHQGFAYGAVNGVFFDEGGNGFVSLNSGASEQRSGHLALLNRDLIRLFLP